MICRCFIPGVFFITRRSRPTEIGLPQRACQKLKSPAFGLALAGVPWKTKGPGINVHRDKGDIGINSFLIRCLDATDALYAAEQSGFIALSFSFPDVLASPLPHESSIIVWR